jgi:diaminopimelate epimerase
VITFTKMHGIGNDFVMVDGVHNKLAEEDYSSLARSICDRSTGVGADGLILLDKPGPLQMRMWNPDGSESEMCGNGLRCFARFAAEHKYADTSFEVLTRAGTLHVELLPTEVRAEMGQAKLLRDEIPVSGAPGTRFISEPIQGYKGTAVSMGNPHLVIFVSNVEVIDLATVGPDLENDPIFPNRTNVHFVQSFPEFLQMRSWERGAGVTLACGTGACAVAVAGYLNGVTGPRTSVHLPGGVLTVEISEDLKVTMTGPAETVFTGIWS